jgi:hypothetical protein
VEEGLLGVGEAGGVAKVGELHLPLRGDEHVVGLQVAVHEVAAVQVVEAR